MCLEKKKGKDGEDKMDVDEKKDDKKEKMEVDEKKEEEKKEEKKEEEKKADEPEPNFELLSNPARVMKAQLKVVSLEEGRNYITIVIRVRACLMLINSVLLVLWFTFICLERFLSLPVS